MRRGAALAIAGVAGIVAGCSDAHSTMNPNTGEAARIAGLGWAMFAASGAVFALVLGLLIPALLRRDRRAEPSELARGDRRWVILAGIVLPSVVVLSLSAATVWALGEDSGPPELHISVLAHQYWWEVRYDGTTAVTANEIHIPVGRTVQLQLDSADVIHSLWVPELGPKRDLIPGRTNLLTWRAREPGEFRGQCAEYCGMQHANMAVDVIVDPPDVFDDWLRHEAADAVAPVSPEATAGERAFSSEPCAACHTIRGTAAAGTSGPDLTHFAERRTIGAGTVINNRGHLGGWIANSQTLKRGNLMPPIPLTPDELRSLLSYLEGLR